MRKLILSVAALALVASPALAGKYNKVISVGEKAPTFSGIPAVSGDQDTSLSLSDIKEPVVVVVFLANHCPYVVAAEDRIQDFAKDYKDKGNYTYGYDETQAIGKAYGATNTPQYFVLDKDRVIRYTGAMDDSPMKEAQVKKTYLRDAVDALLAGKAPEVDETRAVGCGIGYTRGK
jgi:thiol-disulfide isomerase/thioredoxin